MCAIEAALPAKWLSGQAEQNIKSSLGGNGELLHRFGVVTARCADVDGHSGCAWAGVSDYAELKYYKQVQATARPANASDPQLKIWIKTAAPVIAQVADTRTSSQAQFRDPTTAWKQVCCLSYRPYQRVTSNLSSPSNSETLHNTLRHEA